MVVVVEKFSIKEAVVFILVVEAVTSGQQKTRISVCFTASASGTKLPVLVLIPRKKPLKNFTAPNNLVVVYGTNGTFNESLVCEYYVPNVLVSYKNEKKMSNLHFLYDQAPCCMTKRVSETFAAASVRKEERTKADDAISSTSGR